MRLKIKDIIIYLLGSLTTALWFLGFILKVKDINDELIPNPLCIVFAIVFSLAAIISLCANIED